MAYDSAISTFTTKTDKVDLVSASHINTVQAELVTIETILGTGVKGNRADLKTRLANALDADGSIFSGSSYPSPALPSQAFFRTDLNILYIRNAANTAWLSSSQQVSSFLTQITGAGPASNLSTTGGFDKNGDIVSGQFKAPVAGRYLFNVKVEFTGGTTTAFNEIATVILRKNTTTVSTGKASIIELVSAGVTYVKDADINVVLDLAQNDLVDVGVTATTHLTPTYSDVTLSWFSGAILNGS